MKPRALGLLAALACSLACSGCSYALMRPAPANHEQLEWVDCTSSRVAPVADSVGVVEGIGMALAVEVLDSEGILGGGDGKVSSGGRALQITSLAVAGAYLASAVHGFGGAEECERAKALSNLRQLERAKAEESAPVAPGMTTPGCRTDAECKAGRRCVAGSCTWPEPAPIPAASPSPPAQ